tara:strand:+ start:27005 stop:27202 length:198 start_codon:yes stop_codon:yes gene_type:complete
MKNKTNLDFIVKETVIVGALALGIFATIALAIPLAPLFYNVNRNIVDGYRDSYEGMRVPYRNFKN